MYQPLSFFSFFTHELMERPTFVKCLVGPVPEGHHFQLCEVPCTLRFSQMTSKSPMRKTAVALSSRFSTCWPSLTSINSCQSQYGTDHITTAQPTPRESWRTVRVQLGTNRNLYLPSHTHAHSDYTEPNHPTLPSIHF